MGRARENSVRNLQTLYSIVVVLALESAIAALIDPDRDGLPIRVELVPPLLTFLVTVIPFYHGALRHLDDHYLEQEGRHVREGALFVDFLLLFLEGGIFFAMVALAAKPSLFAYAYFMLLLADILWSFIFLLALSRKVSREFAAYTWSLVNFGGSIAVLAFLIVAAFLSFPPAVLAWGVLIIAVLKTAADYTFSWKHYFPRMAASEPSGAGLPTGGE